MTEKPPRDTGDAAKENQFACDKDNGQPPVLSLDAIRGALWGSTAESNEGNTPLGDTDWLSAKLPELAPGLNDQAMRQLEVIKGLVGVPSGLRVYLGSGGDTALAKVYGKDEVVHVDMDGRSIYVLQKAGYEGISLDYDAYAKSLPEDTELGLLYSMNSGLVPDTLLEKLSDDGIVIANNWHGSANDMAEKPGFEVVGAINEDGDVLTVADALNATGVEEFAVGAEGTIRRGSQGVDEVRGLRGWTIIEGENNPDFIWVFRKTSGSE